MAVSKKPRRKYNPLRHRNIVNRPSLNDCYQVFAPVDDVFASLEAGEIDSVQGVPVFKDRNGDLCEVSQAVEGWVGLWDRLTKGEGIVFDSKPLAKLAAKLRYDSPLTELEVAEAKSVVEMTRTMYMKLPISVTREYARTEEIKIKMENLLSKEAA